MTFRQNGTFRFRLAAFCWALMGIMLWSGHSLAASRMPEFSLPSAADGKTIRSSDFKGKVLLINFFATWCPPCRQEIPALIQLQEEYKRQEFSVLGVSMDQGGSRIVAKFIKKMDMNYPVIMGDSTIARDFGGVIGIPASFLVDRQGNVVKSYPGYVDHQALVSDIKGLLE